METSNPISPLFSIITVTLNPGDLLRPTVESILAQEFTDYEHIIKDGGSTDRSLEFLATLHYSTQGQHQLHSGPDNGIYDAMNQALQLATGQYVYFLNAGDHLLDGRALAQVADVLSVGSRPELVYTDYRTGPDNLLVRNPRRLSPFFLYRTTLNHQCCFFRRDVLLKNGGFDAAYRVLADYECLVRLAGSPGMTAVHLPIPVAHYREGGFSQTSALAGLRRVELQCLRRRHFSRWQRNIFAVCWAMTVPGMRLALLKNRRVNRIYTRLRNRCYHTRSL